MNNALLDEIEATLAAPLPVIDPESIRTLSAAGAALRARMDRRMRAGVRVHVGDDDIEEKRVSLAVVAMKLNADHVRTTVATAQALKVLLSRAHVAMQDQARRLARCETELDEAKAAAAPGAAEAAAEAAKRAEAETAKRAEDEAKLEAARRYRAEPANAAYLDYLQDLWERAHSPDPAVRAAARAEGAACRAP